MTVLGVSPVAVLQGTASSGVPWATVLPAAAVLAYADGFWVVVLREAAGAIERTGHPAAVWLRESTLLLPLYVAGVLLAIIVASRIVGAVAGTARGLLTSWLLIAAGGTVVGAGVLAASSAYDYRLQLDLIASGGAMPGMCATPACLTDLQQTSFALQGRVVAIGVVLLVVTNLVVVAWSAAARGGRLVVTELEAGSPRPVPATAAARRARDRSDDLACVLAAAVLGSAVVHAAVIPEHLDEWTAAGLFFGVLTAVQLLVALLVLTRRTPVVLAGVVVTSVAPLLLWAVSRSTGLPVGPHVGVPESVGLADLAAGTLELVALSVACVLLTGRRERRRDAVDARALWLVLAAVAAVAALGVGGTAVVPLTTGSGGGPRSGPMSDH